MTRFMDERLERQQINDYLTEYERSSSLNQSTSDKVNHIRLLVGNDQRKLSVVLEKCPHASGEFYYGLHPQFDERFLRQCITENHLQNQTEFWEFVKALQGKNQYFSLGRKEEWQNFAKYNQQSYPDTILKKYELENILLGRAILRMASHFSIQLNVLKNDVEKVQANLQTIFKNYYVAKHFSEQDLMAIQQDFFSIIPVKTGAILELRGIWSEELIQSFDQRLALSEQKGTLFAQEKETESVINLAQLYQNLSPYLQGNKGTVYYNGVLPRTLSLNMDNQCMGAEAVKYLGIEIERTTYATVDMFDNPSTLFHPHFMCHYPSYQQQLLIFDSYEDWIQEQELYRLSQKESHEVMGEHNEITTINNYLEKSFHTHGIGVSANIETSDGYLLWGKRNSQAIDQGDYYPSANGQAEFKDENVLFYQRSVYEDIPTLNYEEEIRLDLSKEIAREASSELGIASFIDPWEYYGVSYLSIDNRNKIANEQPVIKRRMHFNVLTHNRTSQSFEDVVKAQKKAVESFESSQLEGVRLNFYRNRRSCLFFYGSNFIMTCYNHAGIVSLFLLMLNRLVNRSQSTPSNEFNLFFYIISCIFEVGIPACVLLIAGRKWLEKCKLRTVRQSINIINSENSQRKLHPLVQTKAGNNWFSLKKKWRTNKECYHKLNPVTQLLYILYFYDKSQNVK